MDIAALVDRMVRRRMQRRGCGRERGAQRIDAFARGHDLEAQMGEPRWIKRFTQQGAPGAYLRVLEPGTVRAGDPIVVEDRPDSVVTVGVMFRALTLQPDLLPLMLDAPLIPDDVRALAARRVPAG